MTDASNPELPVTATAPPSGVDSATTGLDVTAVVVGHNSAHHLRRLATALTSGTLVPERLLLVDNASTDETVASGLDAGFEVLETGSNDGFGAACNVALSMASSEFVLICNPDVSPSPEALELLIAALRETPRAAIAGVAFDRPFLARRFSRISGDVWLFLPAGLQQLLARLGSEVPIDCTQRQVAVDYVVGAFMLCRVSALRQVDGFDERFFLYCEEEDLSRRLGERGWLTLFVPGAKVGHKHSTSSQNVDGSVMAQFLFHSLYWYYRKYHSRTYAELARCIHATCIVLDHVYRALTRRTQAYVPRTALAPFHSTEEIRRKHELRAGGRVL
jgi:N-acetylglucosaminyl-diphospho-decaprenol L-rhamnosyltransferase